jgi:hypothetical protein
VADNAEIAGKMSEALNTATQCSSAETVENYTQLATQLAALDASAGHHSGRM